MSNKNKDLKRKSKVRKSNFTAIFVLFICVSAFYTVESQFLNSYILQVLNLSAYYVAIMVAGSAILSAICFIIAGAYSDSRSSNSKWGRRRPLALGGLIAGLSMILISFQSSYWMVLFIDVVILSIFGNMPNAARKAIIPDVYPMEERGTANANFQVADVLGVIIIMALSLIFRSYDVQTHHIIVISSGGILTIFGSLMFFKLIKEPDIEYEPIPWTISVKKIFKVEEIKKNKSFMKFLLIMVIVSTYKYNFTPYLILFLTDASIDIMYIGIIAGCYGLGIFIGFKIFGPWLNNNPRRKITLFAVMFSAIGFPLMSLFGDFENFTLLSLIFTSVGIMIAGFGSTGLEISQNTWSQDLWSEEERGKFAGLFNLVYTVGQIPGVFLGAWIYETFGLQWIFFGAGIVVLLVGQLFWLADETYQGKKRKN